MARDYYEVLEVPRNADTAQLQEAFRRLARRYHPDVNKDPQAEERFKEINEAYSVLSDPETRARYDRFGPDFRRIPEGAEEAATAGARGRGRRGRGFDERDIRDFGFGERGVSDLGVDIDDLLGGLFGGFGGRGGRGSVAGADQEVELELSLEEAYSGGRRWVRLAGPGGERSYQVTIPPGVTEGQRIRLAGQGGQGVGGGPAGDLYLVVRIAPHPRYRLEGRDLYVGMPVSPWEAALGATVPIDTPGGEVKVKIPPGSSSGRRVRLAGQGMPNPRGQPGDLYAEVQIMVPRKPRRRERELFEELARVSNFDPRSHR